MCANMRVCVLAAYTTDKLGFHDFKVADQEAVDAIPIAPSLFEIFAVKAPRFCNSTFPSEHPSTFKNDADGTVREEWMKACSTEKT